MSPSLKRSIPVNTTNSHCPYCSLNCGMTLQHSEGTVVGIKRWKGSPLSAGAVCSKGASAWEQVSHTDRLRTPLVRVNGELREATWEEALDKAAEGFLSIRDSYGADANAVLSGGSLTNEKAYLMGKLARLALGTKRIDLNGRMCMTSAGAASMKAFGLDRAMTPLSELTRAEVIVVSGANLSNTFPVIIPKGLDKVRKQGGRIIVLDPRAGRFVKPGDLHLALRPGTDAVVANGLLREIEQLGLIDYKFVRNRTTDFEAALAAAQEWTPEQVQHVADISPEQLREAALLLGSADRAMYLHARGSEQQLTGTMNVLSLINVALACGHIGKPGCGINTLTGQRNGQGGREWGQRCDQLPAGRSIDDPEHRSHVAKHWGMDVKDMPVRGETYVEILKLAGRKEVRGLLSISTNIAISAPDLTEVRKQLDALDHFVVIDPFLSETAKLADVVLPGSTFAEEDGTITTMEGRVIAIDQAVPPIAKRGDLDVIRNLARRFGFAKDFSFFDGASVFEEMRTISAGGPIDYAGMTMSRLHDEGGIFWPCPDEKHPGTPQLYQERFAHADGLARFHAVVPDVPQVDFSGQFPLILLTGRVLSHYLSGNQTKRIDAQNRLAPEPVLEIHSEMAKVFNITEGDLVTIRTAQGTSTVKWAPNDGLRPGCVFLPYHWEECNVLTASELDPISGIPALNFTPTSIERMGSEASDTRTIAKCEPVSSGRS